MNEFVKIKGGEQMTVMSHNAYERPSAYYLHVLESQQKLEFFIATPIFTFPSKSNFESSVSLRNVLKIQIPYTIKILCTLF